EENVGTQFHSLPRTITFVRLPLGTFGHCGEVWIPVPLPPPHPLTISAQTDSADANSSSDCVGHFSSSVPVDIGVRFRQGIGRRREPLFAGRSQSMTYPEPCLPNGTA